MSEPQNGRGALFTGGLAAILASACCLGPLVLIALGFSGAWIGNLTVLEPYRPIFIGAALVALQLATRSSDLRTKVSANVRSIRATSQAGVPLADIHAAASCISRTTSSISPEQATRTFGGSSLSIRSPGAV